MSSVFQDRQLVDIGKAHHELIGLRVAGLHIPGHHQALLPIDNTGLNILGQCQAVLFLEAAMLQQILSIQSLGRSFLPSSVTP